MAVITTGGRHDDDCHHGAVPTPGIVEHALVQAADKLVFKHLLVLARERPALALQNVDHLPLVQLRMVGNEICRF